MGMRKETLGMINIAKSFLKKEWEGLRMCELGDQYIVNKRNRDKILCKTYFEDMGVEHTSIDIHGKNGSLPLDLSQPIDQFDPFDIVTNYGTTEHVFQQYESFENIHNLTKEDGVMVHAMPAFPHWENHGFYTYKEDFFSELSLLSGYNVVYLETFKQREKHIVGAILQKTGNPFPTREGFRSAFDKGLHVTGMGIGGIHNNTK